MKQRLVTLLAIIGVISIAAANAPTAHAADINTLATGCKSQNGTGLTPDTAGVVNTSGADLTVFCSIPRSPLASGATGGTFFIDGANSPFGSTTSCSIFVFDFTGAFLGASGASSTAATYDLTITMTSAQLPFFGYSVAQCQLPSGGSLMGVTSVQ